VSGPPARRPRTPVRARVTRRGGLVLKGYIRRSGDRRIEVTLGTRIGLRVLFGQLAARVPGFARAVGGELQCDLSRSDGSLTIWTIDTRSGTPIARPGEADRPDLTARLSVADLFRISAGELDPGRAVLEGRLDFAGDFGVMNRLVSLFGRRA
jgi:hypothetical protein